ncbi:amidohydrolase [Microbulbifer agarilyticus]|uniref:amidohydrolase n=1 Tax=Microbulbifer agarilyticus TaxID=260552 RepID=UPI001C95B532|nr:amidohydrolase [Microbulbifer agarilyticus]MBY6191865.1 amidohydrolase [Microbulbifer agarilyticus]
MHFTRTLLIAILTLACSNIQAATLIHNIAGYHTTSDGHESFEALVFDDGKVLATGKLADLREKFPEANVRDAGGRTLLPGLIDAHGHVLALGRLRQELDVRDLSLEQTLGATKTFAKDKAANEWVLGRGWNQVLWSGKQFPTKTALDKLDIPNPVWLRRVDGHAGWANSAALRLAGIDRETENPEGGEIIKDRLGEPSGILIDNAMLLLERAIPQAGLQQDKASLKAAFKSALSLGLTGIHDAGVDSNTLQAYRELAAEGAIPLRIYPMIAIEDENLTTLLKAGPIGAPDQRLYVRSIKLSADGALGSRGAALLAPYQDKPDERGLLLHPEDEILSLLRLATEHDFQVNVHAIGDRANHIVLNHLYTLHKDNDQKPYRHRVEHAQVMLKSDIPRFPSLGLIASMQPTHATSDKNMAGDRLGEERLEGAYAWRTFLDQGTKIAGGSDFPVEPANPLFGLHAAVTRQDRADKPQGGWRSEQAMTLTEALRAFTLDAAYASHQENLIGNLEPGKFADFILLEKNIFAIAPEDIWQVEVAETWVEGERVYTKAD